MTILFLTRRFYPYVGGVETHVMEVAKILEKRGNKVIIVTENCLQENRKKNYYPEYEELNGIEIIRIIVGKDDWFKKFRIWKKMVNIRSIVTSADVVHCHDVFFWYLPVRVLFPYKKVYTTFHGYETKFPPSRKAILVRKISKKLSSGNVTIGDYIKKWYKTKPNKVLYGGVERLQSSKTYVPQGRSNSPGKTGKKVKSNVSPLKIIFVGRLEKDMGLIKYLKSLDLLKKEKIGYKFDSYGGGKLDNLIKKYGNSNGVVESVATVMNISEVIFSSSYLTMLQALILRKKVIAVYDNPLKEDYLKMSPFVNYVFICKDEYEIVEVIKSIKNASWKSASMVENGYQWAKVQTWGKVVDEYMDLWKL